MVGTEADGEIAKNGVSFYIQNSLSSVSQEIAVPNVHAVFLDYLNLHVTVVVYCPLSNTEEHSVSLINFLNTFCGNKEIVILGDFNLPNINWDSVVDDIPKILVLDTVIFWTVYFPGFYPVGIQAHIFKLRKHPLLSVII